MPRGRNARPARSTSTPAAVVRSLHKQLTAVGLPVTGKEAGRNPTFGPTTKATVKAFQQRFHLPVTGKADAVTTAVLTLAQTVTSEQDPAALQKKIKKAATASTSPAYSYWIARYALMSGDYATALTAAHLVPNFGDLLGGELVGAIDPNWRPLHPQPLPPDLPHPENFYSYRGNLIDPDVLAGLQFDLASLTTQQYAAYLTAHANPTDPATIDPAWEYRGAEAPVLPGPGPAE